LEELDAENTEGDDDENVRGVAPLYISVCANIQTPDEGSRSPLDVPVARSCSTMRWYLDNQDDFADSPCSNAGEARD
jgi:hypothetical protein